MRRNRELTRVTCSGIVDADDYEDDDVTYLDNLGIAVLPVSEIENIFLLPAVSRAIVEIEGYVGAELEDRLNQLKVAIFATLNSAQAVDEVVARYCRRRIDRLLKRIDLSDASSVADIAEEYDRQTGALDIPTIAQRATTRIQEAVRDDDLPKLLANYDNKGLMVLAAQYLKRCKVADFESWIARIFGNDSAPKLVDVIRDILPRIQPQ